jgi:lysophospholipase L1-like esterase
MKIAPLLTCCVALFLSDLTLEADPLIEPNDTLAICGDSITAQHIYSAFIEDYLLMCQPTEGLKVVQFGWGGEQAPEFLARLDNDVFPFKPTIATTCYGMNDGHYAAVTDAVANTYRKAQTDIIEAMKKAGVRTIVLGSPKTVDTLWRREDPNQAIVYNKTLGSLAQIDKEIAAKEGVAYADVYGAMVETMKKGKAQWGEKFSFGGDGVHPNQAGHLVMAYAFLKALGYTGDIAEITVDMDLNKATATPGQEVENYKDGVVLLRSTRYPFCFTGSTTDPNPNATAGVLKCLPFNEELNRYLLVVKGLKTAKAKVTWGTGSKEFSAEDLARGINLAAEFVEGNPFAAQFFRINQAVQLQQMQEEMLVKGFMHDEKNYKNLVPSAADAMDQWIASGMALHDSLYNGVRSLVVPIEHTIKIEPL